MAKQNGLGRAEKLKSRKQIESLFAVRSSLQVAPLRVKYRFALSGTETTALKAGVTVSKTHFRKAVDRNRVKRLVREAWRLQKGPLLAQLKAGGRSGIIFFLYADRQIADFGTLYKAMEKCILLLQQKAAHEKTS